MEESNLKWAWRVPREYLWAGQLKHSPPRKSSRESPTNLASTCEARQAIKPHNCYLLWSRQGWTVAACVHAQLHVPCIRDLQFMFSMCISAFMATPTAGADHDDSVWLTKRQTLPLNTFVLLNKASFKKYKNSVHFQSTDSEKQSCIRAVNSTSKLEKQMDYR